MRPTILIVEDDDNQREGLRKALEPAGYRILLAPGAKEAMDLVRSERVDVMLTDLRMPGGGGMDLMRNAQRANPDLVTILLTAYGTVETAVKAMKEGAYDFLTKPINLDRLEMVVRRALSTKAIERENRDLKRRLSDRFSIRNIVGRSEEINRILDTVRQIAPSRATVLIEGERGTGKELVARAIHGLSGRAERPFIAVHCAALSRELLESELFGHERGAFTGAIKRHIGRFEMADGGTLFLDEVSEMDMATQVKLLRVLQEQEFERVGGSESIRVDVRVIAATNTDLESLMAEGRFREDLYDRLNVVTIRVPPLRERKEDISLLADTFLKEFSLENNKQIKGIASDALRALTAYDWPGNVRELRNTIERMVILARHDRLDLSDLPLKLRENAARPLPAARPAADDLSGSETTIRAAERRMIEEALERTAGNRTEAAALLGISRRTLHRKIKRYGLAIPGCRSAESSGPKHNGGERSAP